MWASYVYDGVLSRAIPLDGQPVGIERPLDDRVVYWEVVEAAILKAEGPEGVLRSILKHTHYYGEELSRYRILTLPRDAIPSDLASIAAWGQRRIAIWLADLMIRVGEELSAARERLKLPNLDI